MTVLPNPAADVDPSRLRKYGIPLLHGGIGIGVALIAHIVVLSGTVGIGILVGHWLAVPLIGEAALLLLCTIAAAVMFVRARRGIGVGMAIGWLAGSAGIGLAVVSVIVASVLFCIFLMVLMLVTS